MNFKFLICKETWMISSEDLPFTEHIYNIHSDTSKEKKRNNGWRKKETSNVEIKDLKGKHICKSCITLSTDHGPARDLTLTKTDPRFLSF